MVRSSGLRRKRSRSRSLTPDHKRSKSSRDYEKDRLRRRSRSRDRLRRSRSRERKKDKKITESRVRTKPWKLKRRSFSRSRSKSKDKNIKKDDKKDAKTEDEPFDPTNLDKVPDKDDEDEWVVTDVIEEPLLEDNGNLEEEYDYEADEDDQYSHHSSTPYNNSCHSSPDRSNTQLEDASVAKENISQDDTLTSKENEVSSNKQESGSEILLDDQENVNLIEKNLSNKKQNVGGKTSSVEKEKLKNTDSKFKESNSNSRRKIKISPEKYEVNNSKRSYSYHRSRSDCQHSEELERFTKEQIKEAMKQDKELHQLRIKHELVRHKAEIKVLEAQLDYWKNKQ